MITFGLGLRIGPGSRHWLNEVATGYCGVFLPGDDHDALYTPSSLYATATLTPERLEEIAELLSLMLDALILRFTLIHSLPFSESSLANLRAPF